MANVSTACLPADVEGGIVCASVSDKDDIDAVCGRVGQTTCWGEHVLTSALCSTGSVRPSSLGALSGTNVQNGVLDSGVMNLNSVSSKSSISNIQNLCDYIALLCHFSRFILKIGASG